MSKELEALKHLHSFAFDFSFEQNQDIRGDYELIKSALERKEKLEKAIKIIKDNYAIDIEKVVDGGYVIICEKGSEFYDVTYLTETEFNLLKEML